NFIANAPYGEVRRILGVLRSMQQRRRKIQLALEHVVLAPAPLWVAVRRRWAVIIIGRRRRAIVLWPRASASASTSTSTVVASWRRAVGFAPRRWGRRLAAARRADRAQARRQRVRGPFQLRP